MAIGPSIKVGELPLSNSNSPVDIHLDIPEWYGVAAPRSELVPAGAAEGATPIGPWDLAEMYYTLHGAVYAEDVTDLFLYRRQLLAALVPNEDSPLIVYGNGENADMQAFVRRYDKPDITIVGHAMTFTVPLVAPDPLRYGVTGESGIMGVFAGSTFYVTSKVNTVPNPDVYYFDLFNDLAPTPDAAWLEFEQDVVSSDFPPAVVLTSVGDAVSRRIQFEVTGPLVQGDWRLLHEQTGNELWVDIGLTNEQTLVLDNYKQTARLNGAPVDSLVFGNWLSFAPGPNTYRLVSGQQSDGFANVVNALPAYV